MFIDYYKKNAVSCCALHLKAWRNYLSDFEYWQVLCPTLLELAVKLTRIRAMRVVKSASLDSHRHRLTRNWDLLSSSLFHHFPETISSQRIGTRKQVLPLLVMKMMMRCSSPLEGLLWVKRIALAVNPCAIYRAPGENILVLLEWIGLVVGALIRELLLTRSQIRVLRETQPLTAPPLL